MNYNAAMLEAAGRHLGVAEYPGAQHNPLIMGYYAASGHDWVKDDETPWCAAFIGSICAELGLPHTGKLNARSYLEWGRAVSMSDAQPGDVVVFWRGSPTAETGHVAVLVRFDGDKVIVRGGNQGNKVSDAPYPVSRIVGIRRADGNRMVNNRPTLQPGSTGVFVTDLQDQLARLGYHSGRADGQFGSRTREAVLAFQADNGLTTDGRVGPQTWRALENAKPRPSREVTEQSLREEGSRIITEADKAKTTVTTLMGTGGAALVLDKADEAVKAIESATTLMGAAQQMLFTFWPLFLLAGAGILIWRYTSRIKAARVEDAQAGRHIGR